VIIFFFFQSLVHLPFHAVAERLIVIVSLTSERVNIYIPKYECTNDAKENILNILYGCFFYFEVSTEKTLPKVRKITIIQVLSGRYFADFAHGLSTA